MKTRLVRLMIVLLVGLVATSPGRAQDATNLLANGGFESGNIAPYGTYGNCTTEVVTDCVGATVPEGPIEGKYCLHVVVPAAGANNWDVGMTDGSHSFEQGKKYTFSCFMKTKSGTLQVRLKPERGADPWEAYNEVVATVTDTWQEFTVTTPIIGATVTPASPTFHFAFAPGDFWIDAVRLYEGDYVKPTFQRTFTAEDPSPEDAAVDVPQDVVLGWVPGPFAARHNVYFGTTFDDVNNATVANPLGATVSPDLTDAAYDPDGLLEFGKTYYWRVDEVNAPPDSTVFKGEVWSFTAEPFAYPITGITATASSSDKTTTGPANTINGSGLSNDLHSITSGAMWLSSLTDPGPVWIQYEFDRVYKLYELWVWNYNAEFEPVLGYGFKDVAIEYSLDGTNWTALSDVQFAQATAQDGYAHNTTVDLGGVMAQYVRLTAKSNWSVPGLKQYGLSEVRFLQVPVTARQPDPADGAKDVPLDVTLNWRPGREAVSHEVYLSTDRQAVVDGTALVGTVDDHSFVPNRLEYGMTYFWKVTEVGEAGGSVYEGDVWRFASIEYFVVDDFESYTDDEGNRIYEAWIDGWTNNTGSTVGYLQAPFAEKIIVHSGDQSMPIDFNNTKAPYYSEAERTFDPAQDWTVEGVTQLIVWFRGDGANTAGPLYVALQDSSNKTAVVVHPNPDVVTRSTWNEWRIPLSDFAGVNLARVKTMYIGVGDRNAPAPNGAGMLYVDDIRVGRPATPPDTGPVNLLANGGFEDGVVAPWSAYGAAIEVVQNLAGAAVPEEPIEGNSCLHVTVTTPGANFWDNGLQHAGHVFQKGKQYTLSVFLKCKEGTLDINFKPELAQDPWTGYGAQVITMTDQWAEYSITTPVFTEDVSPATITFHIGFAAAEFWVDGARFYEGTYVPPGGAPEPDAVTNMIPNGGFEDGVLAPWSTYGNVTTQVVTELTGAAVPENVIEGTYCLYVDVAAGIANFWDAGLQPSGEVFQKGKKYTISAFLKSKQGELQVNFKPELGADPWTGYGEQMMTITEEWAEYSVTTPVFTEDVNPASFTFHIGSAVGGFWVDNVRFYEGDYVPPAAGK